MKLKLILVAVFCIVMAQISTVAYAVEYSELITRLTTIGENIYNMKQSYNNILLNYPDVINSLSSENKAYAQNLSNNVMDDNLKAAVNSIKTELAGSVVPGADKILDAINDLQVEAENLFDDNKDIVKELKNSFGDLTLDESKQVLKKVMDIVDELGVSVNTTSTYTSAMTILNDAHTKMLEINNKMKTILDNNLVEIKSVTTFDVIYDMIKTVKSKDLSALLDTMKATVETSGLKNSLEDLKLDFVSLKNKLLELQNLNEQDMLLFDDTQKKAIVDKIENITDDYVAFAKLIINTHATNYTQIIVDLAYDLTVDEIIQKTNKIIDYCVDYKEAINDYKSRGIDALNITASEKNSIKKIGLLVATIFAEDSSYISKYNKSTFSSEIDLLSDYIVDELVDYVAYIDSQLKQEVSSEIISKTTIVAQTNIKNINIARFSTVEKIKALKVRIESVFLENRADLKTDLAKGFNVGYSIYYNNILETIEKIMLLENQKTDKQLEFNSLHYYVVFDKFLSLNEIASIIGIPNTNLSILSNNQFSNNKVRTGSTFTITLRSDIYQLYNCVVLGDMYMDGEVEARDYMKLKNYLMGKDALSDIAKIAANTYRDNTLDARDYMVIKNQIMEKDTISL